ncbi:MAG: cation diffusion facilitator family transporter [Actinomycetota bacterium]|nr:cation diffusion facilitator family transporter [Actinomycetota bacterium]
MAAGGGTRAVLAAMFANAGIALAKFVGFLMTGSSSMIAESVHSVADTSNQGLLLLGMKTSKRGATSEHPFGYGRDRYFYSFLVALVLFTLGAVFAIYEGIHKIEKPEPLTTAYLAVVILLVAIALETYSFHTAIVESVKAKGEATWVRFIRQAKTPELPVVLLEDAGALCGLILALGGVGLSVLTGNAMWDGIATVFIGVLLGAIALILIMETKSLLIGEGSGPTELRTIREALTGGAVDRVIHVKTQYIGPDELLVAAKIAVHGSRSTEEVANAIDEAEARIRAAVPAARMIYLEPDLDRTTAETS